MTKRIIEANPPNVAKLKKRLKDYYEHPGEILGLPTGFTELDELTLGLEAQELTYLAARPSMGKSALAHKILLHAACNCEVDEVVVLVSQEMSSEQVLMRMASVQSGVPRNDIRRGKYKKQGQWYKTEKEKFTLYKDAYNYLEGLTSLRIIGQACTTEELHDCLQRLTEQEGLKLKLVVDDYLGLHSDAVGGDSLNTKLTYISRAVKEYTQEFDCPWLVLHQLSRAVEARGGNHVPMLSDLRDSGSLEQDADNVWFLVRPEYYATEPEAVPPAERGKAYIYIAKARNGELGRATLKFTGATTDFTDWEQLSASREAA